MSEPTPQNNEDKSIPAFRLPTKKSHLHPNKLREFEGNLPQNYQIRCVAQYSERALEDMSRADAYRLLETKGEMLTHLADEIRHYKIAIAPTYHVVGDSEENGLPSLFVVTAEVDGVTAKDLLLPSNHDTKELHDALPLIIELVDKLVDYLHTKVANREDFYRDIFKPDQYVFGTIKGLPQPDLYFIDTDSFELSSPEYQYQCLIRPLGALLPLIEKIEQLVGPEVMLNARNKLIDTIDNLKLSKDDRTETYDHIKRRLLPKSDRISA